jgi:hypothetical protein
MIDHLPLAGVPYLSETQLTDLCVRRRGLGLRARYVGQ